MKPTFRKCFCLLFGMLFVIPVLAKQESISMDSLVVNIAAIEELSQVYLQLQTDTNKLAVLEKVKIAFEQSKECEIDTLTIKLGKFISDCYYFDYDSLSTSLQYSYEIFPLAKKTDLKSAAVIANDIAYIYSEFSDWENSLKYYIQANDFYEASADSTMTNYVLGNISNIYFSIKDYPKSMYYNNLALSKSKQLAEPAKSYSMYYDYTQLAAIYLETNQIDSAQFYYSEALKQVNQYLPLAKKKEDSILLVMVLNHLAKFYHETNDFQQSKVYIDSTLTLLSEEKGFYHTNKIYIDIVTLLIEQNHIQDSKKYLDKVGNTLNKKEKITEYLKYETALTNYYEVIQNYQLAFISQKKIDSLKSEINTKEKLRQAELANAKFLQAKREAQVANQIALFEKQAKVDKEKLEQQRLTSLVTFALMALLMLFIVGLASMLLYINKKKKKYTQQLKDEVSLKTQKLASINNDLIQTNYELQHFNHIISHDLKEPLRTIVSFSNLAVRRLEPNSEIAVYLDYVIKGGEQLHTLIRDVLEFQNTSKTIKNLEQVNLNETLEEVKMSLTRFLEDKNGIVTYSNLPQISSHRTPLFIIFKNIIENGLKYNQSNQPEIIVTYASENNEHLFFIKDNGIGIEPMYQQQVFEMFSRLHTRDIYNGSGLGLALVQKLAYQMGGEIGISESSPNQGTTFLLRLPIKDAGKLAESAIKAVNYKLN